MNKVIKTIKEFNYALFVFLVLAGKCVITNPDIAGALAFITSCCLYGYLRYLDKHEQPELNKDFEKDLEALRNSVDSIKIAGIAKKSHQNWSNKN